MTVPTKAIEAAEAACPDEHISLGHWERKLSRPEMLKVLEAAAPHICADERQRIIAWLNEHAEELQDFRWPVERAAKLLGDTDA